MRPLPRSRQATSAARCEKRPFCSASPPSREVFLRGDRARKRRLTRPKLTARAVARWFAGSRRRNTARRGEQPRGPAPGKPAALSRGVSRENRRPNCPRGLAGRVAVAQWFAGDEQRNTARRGERAVRPQPGKPAALSRGVFHGTRGAIGGIWRFQPLGLWALGLWAFGPLGLWAFGPLGLWARVVLCPCRGKARRSSMENAGHASRSDAVPRKPLFTGLRGELPEYLRPCAASDRAPHETANPARKPPAGRTAALWRNVSRETRPHAFSHRGALIPPVRR